MLTSAIQGFINVLIGFIEGLIGLRVVLKLLGANASADFVNWVYRTSEPLLNPFSGAFPAPVLTGGFVIEFSALFAMLVYALAGYLLLELLEAIKPLALNRIKPIKTKTT